jgi:hypothetical protein
MDLQESTDLLRVKFANFLPPKQDEHSGLFRVLRVGECFYSNTEKCNGNWTFHPEIGYTRDLIIAGLDEQMYTFIEAAKAFIADDEHTLENDHYKLLALMCNDFQESLSSVQQELLVFTGAMTQRNTLLVILIAVLILIAFTAMIYIGTYLSS